ncbi:hypothetical protein K2173_011489 [Erythroxylum novogranatense]|uniref:Uncharacterized protein n=1 Tax=Erythroxylum novogranatense TaxID=1862640 RepID=A0AAV8TVQ9_9ROSI|nr:hypothetical protein K2173_011489 [Erythroxylum novogranatense]
MSSLIILAPQKVVIAETGEEVDTNEVKINPVLAVKAGQVIPIDGVVVDGKCKIDEKTLTGDGAEDVALIEYAKLTGRPFRVFSLDIGRLNPETYQFFDTVEKHYGIRIEYMFPDAVEVQALVRSKGLFSFYEDGHRENERRVLSVTLSDHKFGGCRE